MQGENSAPAVPAHIYLFIMCGRGRERLNKLGYVCGGQRTTCSCQCFSSTTLDPGIELRSLDLVASASTHRAILPASGSVLLSIYMMLICGCLQKGS